MAHEFIPFRSGSDERDTEYAPGAPLRLVEDMEYHEGDHGLVKRHGFETVGSQFTSDDTVFSTMLSNGSLWGVLRRWDFCSAAGDAGPRQGTKGGLVSNANHFRTERALEVRDGEQLLEPHVVVVRQATSNTLYACVVAARGTTESLVQIVEVDSGVVIARQVITGHATPRVAVAGDNFLVFARNTSTNVIDLYVYDLDSTALVTRTDIGAVSPAITSGSVFDCCTEGATALLSYRRNSSNDLGVVRLAAAGTTSASIEQAVTGAAPQQSCVFPGTAGIVHVVHCAATGTNTAYLETFAANLSARTSGSTAVFTAVADQSQVYATVIAGQTTIALVSQVMAPGPNTLRYASITEAHASLSSVTTVLSAAALTKPFSHRYGTGVGRPFLGLRWFRGGTEANYFPTAVLGALPLGTGLTVGGATFASSGVEHGGLLWNDAASDLSVTGLPNRSGWSQDPDTDDYYTAITNIVSFDGHTSGVSVSQTSVAVVRVRTDLTAGATARTALPKVVLESTAYMGGAMLRFFDGVSLGEVVPMPPQALTLAAGSGAALAAGTYNYVAVAVWEDGQGNLHRSAPTPPVAFVHGGANGIVASLNFHIGTMLDSDVGSQKWELELYRTEAGGATFYYQQTATGSINSTVTFVEDDTDDETLAAHRALYTTGGRLQNEPPPACSALAVHQGRLWGISTQDPHVLFHSLPHEDGIAPEFHHSQTVRVDEPAIAVASMDDKLVVFGERSCWVVLGEGPDELGAGAFSPPERVEGGFGASGPKAALTVPAGVMVHTTNGFKLMGRDLSFQDVDLLAESFGSDRQIGAAIYLPGKAQAWFAAERAGSMSWAVFDFGTDLRAYLFTLQADAGHDAVLDLAVVDGQPQLIAFDRDTPDAQVYRQATADSDDPHLDGAATIECAVTTGWFMPDGPAGDCRFRVLTVRGDQAATDFDYELRGTVEVQRATEPSTAVNTWTWDVGTAPTSRRVFVRRGRVQRQCGSACRVRLEVGIPEGGSEGVRGAILHGVDIDFAVRNSPEKQAAAHATS